MHFFVFENKKNHIVFPQLSRNYLERDKYPIRKGMGSFFQYWEMQTRTNKWKWSPSKKTSNENRLFFYQSHITAGHKLVTELKIKLQLVCSCLTPSADIKLILPPGVSCYRDGRYSSYSRNKPFLGPTLDFECFLVLKCGWLSKLSFFILFFNYYFFL